ncbi:MULTISPECIES: MFS transporter [Metabacillus]|uniref:Aromatic acid/H+ symport family MFS transporter n=1 Tax=Metabacillus rhizolycopersici TaxID=2875709 RepID=A0ABS7ULW7_9BACI|nr:MULTISPECIES: aromatic acid/H+ symport family MFS transporter [Metabacillus]MBZ5749156.1 aromatic acid/H+ symport family MFS transporter [Metabacillus rhizolycopersici]MCM3653042.1 aromatic acid/H+ symport family MFS transporter [Metabacillus litoralis]
MNPISFFEQSKLKPFHILLVFWLFIILMFEGYDVVIYGATIPFLKESWGISDMIAGSIGSYTTIGTATGAVLFGLYSDRFGRKNIIILTTLMFSLFTMLSGFAPNAIIFTICRVIAGFGFGGVMPNIASLISEYAPLKYRAAIISFIFCGYSVGAMGASFIGQALLPDFGWQPVYWIGGISLLFIPFMLKAIPESLDYLLTHKQHDQIVMIVNKVQPSAATTLDFTYKKKAQAQKSPVSALFTKKFAVTTMMFWLACFCTFILMYSLNTWLPTLMLQAGYTLSSSLMFVAVLQIGSIVGTVILSNIIQKVGFKNVLIPLYLVGAISLTLIGFSTNLYLAYFFIFLIGAATVGLQNMSNAFVAAYYPVEIRSAALGSTMAFGRLGSIVAPTYVAMLLTMNLQPQFNFIAIGIAAVFGMIALFFVNDKHADYQPAHESEANNTETAQAL